MRRSCEEDEKDVRRRGGEDVKKICEGYGEKMR